MQWNGHEIVKFHDFGPICLKLLSKREKMSHFLDKTRENLWFYLQFDKISEKIKIIFEKK